MKVKYLIIGNSAGGLSAANAIRKVDQEGEILIISDEPYGSYSRPALTQFLAGSLPIEMLYLKNQFDVILGRKAVELDLSNKEVVLEDGERIGYHKLLLATGSSPLIPKEWLDLEGVFTFGSLSDAKKISEAAKPGGRVVVIGAGLIGVSAAKALKERGLEVFLIARSPRIFVTLLDEKASHLIEERLIERGIFIRVNSQGERIEKNPLGVFLGTGEFIPADLIVVGRGVRPRVELALGTPIKVDRGIIVDRHMSTNIPDVYACGDVAQCFDLLYQTNRVNPNWVNAVMGGGVAGINMAGGRAEFSCFSINTMNIFGLPFVAAGITKPYPGWEVLERIRNENYIKIVVSDGRIKGFIMVGDIERSGLILNLMRRQLDISPIKGLLLEEGLNILHLRGLRG